MIPKAPSYQKVVHKKSLEEIIEELDTTFHKSKDYENKLFYYEGETVISLSELASELRKANYIVSENDSFDNHGNPQKNLVVSLF